MQDRTLNAWARKIGNSRFKFTFKIPGSITHEKLIGNIAGASDEMQHFKTSHLDFLAEKGLLGGVLFQLPPYFGTDNIENLEKLLSSVDMSDVRVFIEPRNKSLYSNSDFEERIKRAGASVVTVDSPEQPISVQDGQRHRFRYFRLHGRNTEAWKNRKSNVFTKYDYEYNRDEIQEIAGIIRKSMDNSDEIFVFFNNHPSGKAPRNARALMATLGIKIDVRQGSLY